MSALDSPLRRALADEKAYAAALREENGRLRAALTEIRDWTKPTLYGDAIEFKFIARNALEETAGS